MFIFLRYCEILVAIVFGHDIHILFLKAKIHISIPKFTEEGGGGTTGLRNIPKKNFLVLP